MTTHVRDPRAADHLEPPRFTERPGVFPLAVMLSLAVLAVAIIHAARADPGRLPPGLDASVSATPIGRPLPSGYLGLSTEYSSLEAYAGTNPDAIDPRFAALVRSLTPGQQPVLRIGGDSADWTWWPIPGIARPPGVTFALDRRWLQIARETAKTLNAQLILGLNLEADDSGVAAVEAQHLLRGIGAQRISALQLGNEPELYGQFPWYHDASGYGVPGRPASYSFVDFQADFIRIGSSLPSHPLAGPSTGGPGWQPQLAQFLSNAPRVRIVTLHRYPLQLCHTSQSSVRYPTVAHLLSPAASTTFAQGFASAVKVAHARGLPLRIDELNTVSCGADPAISQTFASALWALDTLFELARVGVDGVEIHTFPGAGYELFVTSGGHAAVSPEYYGLLAFAAAAPPGSALLQTTATLPAALKLWATRARDGRERVTIINKDPNRAYTLRLRIAGVHGDATVTELTGPGAAAHGGASWAGQTIAPATGRLAGAPARSGVTARHGRYPITVPAASAAVMTFDQPR
jgi:hypothetical protein